MANRGGRANPLRGKTEIIAAMRAAGMTLTAIAAAFGVSQPAISYVLRQHRERASAKAAPKPGTLYREVLPDGRLSPWVSIVPEARDGGRFDWRSMVPPAFSNTGSPAAACAEVL